MRRQTTALSTRLRIQSVEEFLAHVSGRETLLLAPTRMAGDEIVRELALRNGGSFGVHRFTLPSLAIEIASGHLASQGFSTLAGVAADAMAARAVERCRTASRLAWFEPVATTTGFFRALASTIHELRMNGVDRRALAAASPAGEDLARLVLEFENALSEERIADMAMIYRTALTQTSHFSSLPLVLLDLAPRFLLERQFMEMLVDSSPEGVTVVHQRFSASPEDSLIIKSEPAGALSRLRCNIFSAALTEEAAHEFDASVDFRSATDESREAVEIARSITAATSQGVPFDRIAVLLRNPDAYQPLVEDAFRRAGINAFYTQGSRRPNPAGRAFLALLACAAEGLSASRFGEYLSLGQVPDPEEPVITPWVPVQGELFSSVGTEAPADRPTMAEHSVRAPYAWERLLVDAAVIGGRDRWERRLNGLDNELSRQMQEVAKEDEAKLARLELQRQRLKDLRRFALPLIDRLVRLPHHATWGEWLHSLENLASAALRKPEAVLSALAELRPMANVGPVGMDEVREVLDHRLTFLRTEPTDRRYGKVLVTTIPESAGMSFHTVFLPGLGEDLFPKRAFEDPLLLDEYRRSISSALETQDRRIENERRLLHLALAAADERVVISYPRMNLAQGRARGPSFYAMEVVRAVTGRIPDLQELQAMAAESVSSQAGWPSPKDPALAIDDAEYDLAIVSSLLRVPIQEARGRGRYLVNANDNLARSLRTRSGRWRRKWTEGDGIIDGDSATVAALAKQRIAARPYSATALQHFAACPYRFLLSAVHRLQPRDEIVAIERMDALTRGSLFHSIQFRLLSELRDRRLLPITTVNLADVLEVADVVTDEVAATYREELAPAIPPVWDGEVEDIRWDLRGWIREMIQAEGPQAWTPRWFELAFGLSGRDRDPESVPKSITLPNGLILRGSVDMIEERESGVRVTDHKTGKAPFVAPGATGHGELLQPVLYAYAVENILGRTVESARLFYCTERGGYRSVDMPTGVDARVALDEIVQTIDQSLETAFLPAAPREGACRWCDYQSICGPYEETRVRRKPKERLATLEQIRKS